MNLTSNFLIMCEAQVPWSNKVHPVTVGWEASLNGKVLRGDSFLIDFLKFLQDF